MTRPLPPGTRAFRNALPRAERSAYYARLAAERKAKETADRLEDKRIDELIRIKSLQGIAPETFSEFEDMVDDMTNQLVISQDSTRQSSELCDLDTPPPTMNTRLGGSIFARSLPSSETIGNPASKATAQSISDPKKRLTYPTRSQQSKRMSRQPMRNSLDSFSTTEGIVRSSSAPMRLSSPVHHTVAKNSEHVQISSQRMIKTLEPESTTSELASSFPELMGQTSPEFIDDFFEEAFSLDVHKIGKSRKEASDLTPAKHIEDIADDIFFHNSDERKRACMELRTESAYPEHSEEIVDDDFSRQIDFIAVPPRAHSKMDAQAFLSPIKETTENNIAQNEMSPVEVLARSTSSINTKPVKTIPETAIENDAPSIKSNQVMTMQPTQQPTRQLAVETSPKLEQTVEQIASRTTADPTNTIRNMAVQTVSDLTKEKVCTHCDCRYHGSIWLALWQEVGNSLSSFSKTYRPRLIWVVLMCIALGVWYATECTLCSLFCHKAYATEMIGYGVNPDAPQFPFVLPSMIIRSMLRLKHWPSGASSYFTRTLSMISMDRDFGMNLTNTAIHESTSSTPSILVSFTRRVVQSAASTVDDFAEL